LTIAFSYYESTPLRLQCPHVKIARKSLFVITYLKREYKELLSHDKKKLPRIVQEGIN
jgi:hypothetical protein